MLSVQNWFCKLVILIRHILTLYDHFNVHHDVIRKTCESLGPAAAAAACRILLPPSRRPSRHRRRRHRRTHGRNKSLQIRMV